MARNRLSLRQMAVGVAVGAALFTVGWSTVEVVLGVLGGMELSWLAHCAACADRSMGPVGSATGTGGTGAAGAGTPPGTGGMSDDEIRREIGTETATDATMEGLGQGADEAAKAAGRTGAGPSVAMLGIFYTIIQGSQALAEGIRHTHDYEYYGSKSKGGSRSMDAAMDEIVGKKKPGRGR